MRKGAWKAAKSGRTQALKWFSTTRGTGVRPAAQQANAPLSDDDRTGLRTLYGDPNDTIYVGSIQGRILPANLFSLPSSPPGVTGIRARFNSTATI